MLKILRLLSMVPVFAVAFCAVSSPPRMPAPVQVAFSAGPNIQAVSVRGGAVYSTHGYALGISPAIWRRAHGHLTARPSGAAGMVVHCAFSGLVPFGIYSLFIGDGNSPSRRLRPLDGSGENNSFEAPIDGTAAIDVHAARSFSPSDVVVLVFHADGYTYGSSPGRLGYDALEQLVARISYALGMNAR